MPLIAPLFGSSIRFTTNGVTDNLMDFEASLATFGYSTRWSLTTAGIGRVGVVRDKDDRLQLLLRNEIQDGFEVFRLSFGPAGRRGTPEAAHSAMAELVDHKILDYVARYARRWIRPTILFTGKLSSIVVDQVLDEVPLSLTKVIEIQSQWPGLVNEMDLRELDSVLNKVTGRTREGRKGDNVAL
jgi:hypothetical protein